MKLSAPIYYHGAEELEREAKKSTFIHDKVFGPEFWDASWLVLAILAVNVVVQTQMKKMSAF